MKSTKQAVGPRAEFQGTEVFQMWAEEKQSVKDSEKEQPENRMNEGGNTFKKQRVVAIKFNKNIKQLEDSTKVTNFSNWKDLHGLYLRL